MSKVAEYRLAHYGTTSNYPCNAVCSKIIKVFYDEHGWIFAYEDTSPIAAISEDSYYGKERIRDNLVSMLKSINKPTIDLDRVRIPTMREYLDNGTERSMDNKV